MTVHFLLLDTETGGLSPTRHSLLTAAFRLVDGDTLETLRELEFALKPLGGRYYTTPEAMEINGIDLTEHAKAAVWRNAAGLRFEEFLGGERPAPVGYNLPFDLKFLHMHFLSPAMWRVLCPGPSLDLLAINKRLHSWGHSPATGCLAKVCAAWGIEVKNAHTAMGDVEMTHQLLKCLLAIPEAREFSGREAVRG